MPGLTMGSMTSDSITDAELVRNILQTINKTTLELEVIGIKMLMLKEIISGICIMMEVHGMDLQQFCVIEVMQCGFRVTEK